MSLGSIESCFHPGKSFGATADAKLATGGCGTSYVFTLSFLPGVIHSLISAHRRCSTLHNLEQTTARSTDTWTLNNCR